MDGVYEQRTCPAVGQRFCVHSRLFWNLRQELAADSAGTPFHKSCPFHHSVPARLRLRKNPNLLGSRQSAELIFRTVTAVYRAEPRFSANCFLISAIVFPTVMSTMTFPSSLDDIC